MAEASHTLPDIDFATFLLSLGSSALMHLGEVSPELAGESGPPVVELTLAKQTIDILAMLETKTRGNRDEAEDRLLQSLLYDLRIKYVDALRRKK